MPLPSAPMPWLRWSQKLLELYYRPEWSLRDRVATFGVHLLWGGSEDEGPDHPAMYDSDYDKESDESDWPARVAKVQAHRRGFVMDSGSSSAVLKKQRLQPKCG